MRIACSFQFMGATLARMDCGTPRRHDLITTVGLPSASVSSISDANSRSVLFYDLALHIAFGLNTRKYYLEFVSSFANYAYIDHAPIVGDHGLQTPRSKYSIVRTAHSY